MRGSVLWGVRLSTLAVLMAAMNTASASYLKLASRASARFSHGAATVTVHVVNKGDEVVETLQVEAQLGDVRVLGTMVQDVAPETTVTCSVVIEDLPPVSGMHTVALRLRYTSTGGDMLSTCETIPVVTGDPGFGMAVSGELSSISIANDSDMKLRLVSSEAHPLDLRYRVILPDEFASENGFGEIRLDGGASVDLDIGIKNKWATPGSRYAVYVQLDSVVDGVHQSDIVKASVSVAKRKAISKRTKRLGWSTVVVLLMVGVSLEVAAYQRSSSRI
ncbi:MAG: hypothetical protein OSB41_05775 [Kiritimatiellae bacterium]|nr:hypothetical protein [Kiritimatiellia bacterium]